MTEKATMEALARLVPEGSRVLDLGCGDGSMLDYLQRSRGCSGYGIEIADANVKVYLFGSWARGEERRSSDIDIALDWVGGAPPDKLARLRDVLAESDVPFRVDVVDLSSAGEVLAGKVAKEGVQWKG